MRPDHVSEASQHVFKETFGVGSARVFGLDYWVSNQIVSDRKCDHMCPVFICTRIYSCRPTFFIIKIIFLKLLLYIHWPKSVTRAYIHIVYYFNVPSSGYIFEFFFFRRHTHLHWASAVLTQDPKCALEIQ